MLRRHAVSLALALSAILLAAYLYLVDSGRITTAEQQARQRNLLPAYRRAEISELIIQSNDETTHIVRRADDAGSDMFHLDGGELADQTAVDKALAALEFATPERRLEPPQERHALGLDAPRLRVTLVMGAITYRIAFGAPAPAPPGAVYAAAQGQGIEGEQLCVLPRDLLTELSRPRDVYRSRTLVPYLSSLLSSITLETRSESHELVRVPVSGWAIAVGAQKVRVDREAFDRFLTALADLRAEAFTSDVDAEQVLAAAEDRVRLVLTPSEQGAPRGVLVLGGACKDHPEDAVAVRSEPAPKIAACVPNGVLSVLLTPAATLEDRHPFSLRPDEMEQIELVAGDKRIELARAGTGWHLRAPSEGSVDADVGQAFAKSLHDLSCEETVSLPLEEAGLSVPKGRAVVRKVGEAADGGSDREEVQIGAPRGGKVYIRRLADGAILRCDPDAAEELSPSGPSLRSRKVVDVSAGQVRKVVIHGAEVRAVLSRSSSGGWTLDEPKSLSVDPGLAVDVSEALAQLRADRWVADEDDGSYGLAAPRASYELVLEAGVVRIEVGRRTERGSFARRTDLPGVFVLPLATEQKLETWPIDRSYFMVDPDEARQVRLVRGASSQVLGPAKAADGDDAARAAERWEIAKRVLAEARTEGVVHLGAPRPSEGFDKPRLVISVTKGKAGSDSTLRIVVGAGDVFHDTNVFFVRRDGVDATFAMAQGKLRPLLEMN
jgi:hypothetical protein